MRVRCPGCESVADALPVDGGVQVCAHYEDAGSGVTCGVSERVVGLDGVEVIER